MAEAAGSGQPPAGRLRLSQVLRALASEGGDEPLGIGEIARTLRDRAFGAVLLVFAAPNILPVTVPGTSSVTALPILLVAVQMLLGRRSLRLPAAVERRGLERRRFRQVVDRLGPWLARAERLARPRLGALVTPAAERLVAIPTLLLGLILFLPLPLSNIPPGIALAILGLGLMERDGGLVAAGLAAGVVAVLLFSTVTGGLVELGILALRATFL